MGSSSDFDRIRRIGQGGMGEVWEAIHRPSRTRVALKVNRPGDEPARATQTGEHYDSNAATQLHDPYSLTHEIRAMASLDHECIAPIFDHGVEQGTIWFASGYAENGDLRQRPPTSWDQAQDVLEQILRALAHAHSRGVIHRDLKPANVLLNGTSGIWLTDFGIAWCGQGAESAGTPHYMAPEQIHGWWRQYGPWTDLYALGCLAWWLITGRPPFAHTRSAQVLFAQAKSPPPPLKPSFSVPEGLTAWLLTLLAKHPAQRFRTAPDALEALQHLTQDSEETLLYRAPGDALRLQPPLPTTHRFAAASLALLDVRPLPLVGREEAFLALAKRLRISQRGRYQAAAACGDGMGCTHLLHTFARQASQHGAASTLLLSGSSRSEVLESFRKSQTLDGLAPAEHSELDAWLRMHPRVERTHLVRLVEGTLGFTDLGQLIARLDPKQVTLVVMSGSQTEFLHRALQRLDAPVLLLADNEELDIPTLHLGPLSSPAVVQLGWSMAGLDAESCRELHARLAGNPTAITSLIRRWAATGVLTAGEHGVQLGADPFSALDSDLTVARVMREAWPNGSPEALQLMCLLGPDLERSEAKTKIFGVLKKHGLAHESQHAAHLDARLCQWVTARIPVSARHLWSAAADRVTGPFWQLECLIRAGRTNEAAESFITLSTTNFRRMRRMRELWRMLHPLVSDEALAIRMEVAHLWMLTVARDFRVCIPAFEALNARVTQPAQQVEVKRGYANALRISGQAKESLAAIIETIDIIEKHNLPQLGRSLMDHALALESTQPKEAARGLARARQVAEAAGDDVLVGRIHVAQGRYALTHQQPGAIEHFRKALKHPLGPIHRVAAIAMLSSALADAGQLEDAERVCAEAVRLSQEQASQHLGGILAIQAKVHLRRGNLEEAWRSALRGQQVAAQLLEPSYSISNTLMLARIGAERGESIGEELHRLRTYLAGGFASLETVSLLDEITAATSGLDAKRAHWLASKMRAAMAD